MWTYLIMTFIKKQRRQKSKNDIHISEKTALLTCSPNFIKEVN